MSLHRRQLSLLRQVVTDTGAPVQLELLDGPGYYALRRLAVARVAGAGAATYSPVLAEQLVTDPIHQVFGLAAPIAAAQPLLWPEPGLSLGEASRYGYFVDGRARLLIGANVAGDGWAVALLVERLR